MRTRLRYHGLPAFPWLLTTYVPPYVPTLLYSSYAHGLPASTRLLCSTLLTWAACFHFPALREATRESCARCMLSCLHSSTTTFNGPQSEYSSVA